MTAGTSPVVLLVEDEELVRQMTQSYLGAHGYTVLAASSGADALQLVENNRPRVDGVLTDVVMPGMSGPDLVRQIEAMLDQPAVVFMSGYAADKLGPLEQSAEFVSKPFSLELLDQTLARLLRARRPIPVTG